MFFSVMSVGFAITNAQTTAFTYQGRLTDANSPPTANYDFEFRLFDALIAGTQQGATQSIPNVAVAGGVFTVTLDFGSQFPGANRFIEIWVRPAGGPGGYQQLLPRQPITSTPYSIKSANAGSADSLTGNCVGCVTASQIGSISGSSISGPIPVASLPPGSGDYIQNQNSGAQASSNFNISGTGTAGILNAGTQFNFAGQRILAAQTAGFIDTLAVGIGAGSANTTGVNGTFVGKDSGLANTSGCCNTYVGAYTGTVNTTGQFNTYVGQGSGEVATGSFNSVLGGSTGQQLTTGSSNSFFGVNAGNATQDGNENSFFGRTAGASNGAGNQNSFFGFQAGRFNTTGSNNTAIGAGTSVGNTLTFATALGAGASVITNNTVVIGRAIDTVQIPGILNATLPAGSGNYIQNTTSPQATSNFNISGNGVIGGSLGIGTSAPTSLLTVGVPEATTAAGRVNIFNTAGLNLVLRDTTNDVEGFFGVNSSNGVFIGSALAHNMALRTDNTARLTVEHTTGDVGIGTASPTARLHVNGTGLFSGNLSVTSAAGNGSVALPNDAISAAETLDEPGVASATANAFINLDGTTQTLLSRQITVPAAGFVLVIGSFEVSAAHTNGTQSSANFGVSAVAGTFPLTQSLNYLVSGAAPTGSYLSPISVHGLFQVAAGTHTFFLLGDEAFGNLSVDDLSLSLLFVPSSYGTVTPTLADGTTEEPSKDRTVESGPSNDVILLDRLKRQQTEIDALKKLVCTQFSTADVCKP